MLGVPEWESRKSLVALNFELKFRSEGICGLDLNDGAKAREGGGTYVVNGERVVDVVSCCDCFCK